MVGIGIFLECGFKVLLSIIFTGMWIGAMLCVWRPQIDVPSSLHAFLKKPFKAMDWLITREQNKIYQGGTVVGEVTGPVQENRGSIQFSQLTNTSALDPTTPFEYQRHTLLIRSIGAVSAMKAETHVSGSGVATRTGTGVLENVVCDKM